MADRHLLTLGVILYHLCQAVHGTLPVFTINDPYTHPDGISESISAGSRVMTISAVGGTVAYSLLRQSPDTTPKKFQVAANTGAITTTTGVTFDREGTDVKYTLVIQARDTAGSAADTATSSVIIDILDYNDNGPIPKKGKYLRSFSGLVKEGTDVVLIEASDSDTSASNNRIKRFFLNADGNEGSVFHVTDTGMIKVALSKVLDPVVQVAYILKVDIVDTGTPSQTGTATVYIGVCGRANTLTGSRIIVMTTVAAYLLQ